VKDCSIQPITLKIKNTKWCTFEPDNVSTKEMMNVLTRTND